MRICLFCFLMGLLFVIWLKSYSFSINGVSFFQFLLVLVLCFISVVLIESLILEICQ